MRLGQKHSTRGKSVSAKSSTTPTSLQLNNEPVVSPSSKSSRRISNAIDYFDYSPSPDHANASVSVQNANPNLQSPRSSLSKFQKLAEKCAIEGHNRESEEEEEEEEEEAGDDEDEDSIYPLEEHATLFLFGPKNPIRRFCAAVLDNYTFDCLVILMILVSSITLAIDTPLLDPLGSTRLVCNFIDWFTTFFFVFEMLLKFITQGLVGTPNAYFSNSWNSLDFAIVTLSVISLIAGTDIPGYRVLRSMKTIRPLRILRRLEVCGVFAAVNYTVLFCTVLYCIVLFSIGVYCNSL